MQQGVQLLSNYISGSGPRAGIAPSESCAVIRTNMCERCCLGLNLVPGKPGIPASCLQDDGGRALSDAVEMQAITTDVHEPAGRMIQSPVAMTRYRFIDCPGQNQRDNET